MDFFLSLVHPSLLSNPNGIIHFIQGFTPSNQLYIDLENELENFKLNHNIKCNIKILTARLKNKYGTHHSKLMILKYKNHKRKIIITTVNLIPFDWGGLTQGIWKSPFLLLKKNLNDLSNHNCQFENDFLEYLKNYKLIGLKNLINDLEKYDFSNVKGIFIASVPGTYSKTTGDYHKFALGKLKKSIETYNHKFKKIINISSSSSQKSQINAQVSSIATLSCSFVETFLNACNGIELTHCQVSPKIKSKSKSKSIVKDNKSLLNIIFPTPQEVANSKMGYLTGTAIHFRNNNSKSKNWYNTNKHLFYKCITKNCGREKYPLHIKTYIKYDRDNCNSNDKSNHHEKKLDWILMTSANLSHQAWGFINFESIRCGSYECGILLYPELWDTEKYKHQFIPLFNSNIPLKSKDGIINIGIRLPYDLPITQYNNTDEPWCILNSYDEKDSQGLSWPYD